MSQLIKLSIALAATVLLLSEPSNALSNNQSQAVDEAKEYLKHASTYHLLWRYKYNDSMDFIKSPEFGI